MPGSSDALPNLETVTLERDGHVLLIGLNRPDKRNAFNQAMLTDLSRAYALRWLLTGDEFDAAEAHRIGLVQEVVDDGAAAVARVREVAQTIAERAAPLAVQATLASAHLAREQGDAAAIERLRPDVAALF